MSKKTYRILILMSLFPLIVGLACLKSKPKTTPTPEQDIEIETIIPEPEKAETEEVDETPESSLRPESGSGLVLNNNGMWTYDNSRVYAFNIVENLSDDLMYEDVTFKTSFFDASGGLVDEETQIVAKIFPGQKVGLTPDIWLSDDDEEVDKVVVDWTYKRTSPADADDNPFSIYSAKYWDDDYHPMVTGEIFNNDLVTYTNFRVSIICYNHAGDIIGGGMEYLDFIHDEDYMGFVASVKAYDDVEAVDVFPYMSWDTGTVEVQDSLSIISVEDMGYSLDDFDDISGGFVIENLTNDALKYSYFQVTFYDENDDVTATGSTYISLLLPGDTVGLSPIISFQPQGAVTDNFAVSVLPGEVVNDYEIDKNPFVIKDVFFIDEDGKDIKVELTNTFNKSISNVDIYVLAYDEDGYILGGSNDWIIDPIAAGATIEHEMWMYLRMGDSIAELRAWAIPNYYSDFK